MDILQRLILDRLTYEQGESLFEQINTIHEEERERAMNRTKERVLAEIFPDRDDIDIDSVLREFLADKG